jgi:large subunit ribosomal protein L33
MGDRIKIGLKCEESGDINYTTMKNPKTHSEKFEVKNIVQDLKNTLHIKKLS